MASIEKRGDNAYRISVSNGYDRNNKKLIERKTVRLDPNLTEKQREKELDRLAALFEEEVKSGNVYNSSITFEQFTQRWLIEYGENQLQKSTLVSYKGELETKILPAIGHIKLNELKPLHLIRFLDNLTEDGIRLDGKRGGYSTRVIKYQHSIISSILQTAVYWQIMKENIANRVKPPAGADKKNSKNYFNEYQIKYFLEFVLETEPIEFQALAFVTAYGGLRKGEVLGLTWADVDFKSNTVSVTKAMARASSEIFIKAPKNPSSIRIVTLPAVAMALLKQLKLCSTNLNVFPMSYSTPTHWFKRIVKNYNAAHDEKLPDNVTFHGLRHTSATLLIAQGLDIKTVSSRLGHADTTTTLNIYAHALMSKDKIASDTLENLIDITC